MAEAVELGVAYLSIVPTMRGAQKTIARELTAGADAAGADAGSRAGSAWTRAFKGASDPGSAARTFADAWSKAASVEARDGGRTFGEAFTGAMSRTSFGSGILTGVRSSMRAAAAEGARGGTTLGQVFTRAATSAVSGMRQPMQRATQAAMAGVTATAKASLAAVAALTGTALAKGFDRLQAIDQAQAKLKGLGHSAAEITTIMENANTAVKGTAFGLGDAATAAASAVAAGIKPGQQLAGYLTLIGDSATIAGTSFTEMGAIFNKVAASQKIQGEEIAQLSDRGIPIIQLLSKQLGVSAAQVTDLASKGKIGFADFAAAMKAGMGGAAQESGATFTGALNNVMASLGRIGANLIQGIFSKMPGVFAQLQGALAGLEPVAKRAGAAIAGVVTSGAVASAASVVVAALRALWSVLTGIGSVLAAAAGWVDRWRVALGFAGTVIGTALLPVVVPLLARFVAMQAVLAGLRVAVYAWTVATRAAAAAQLVMNAVLAANPVGLVLTAVTALAAGLVYLWRTSETFRSVVTSVWAAVRGAFTTAGAAAGVVLTQIRAWFAGTATAAVTFAGQVQGVLGAVGAAVRAAGSVFTWLWRSVIVPVFSGAATTITTTVTLITNILVALVNVVRAVVAIAFLWLWRSVIVPAWTGIRAAIAAAWAGIAVTLTAAAAYLRGPFTAAWQWIRSVVTSVWAAVTAAARAAWSAILGVLSAAVTYLRGVFSSAWQSASSACQAAWTRMAGVVRSGWEQVIRPAFAAITRGIQALPGVFGRARDAIGAAWDGIRRAALRPVEFVVQTVLNQGLIKGVNKIGSQFGVSVGYIPWTISLAGGGPVRGWSPHATADNIPAWLTAGEFVTRRRSADRMRRRHPGALEYINRYGRLPGYGRGGVVYDSARPGPGMGARTSPIRGARPADAGVWRQLKAWLAANIPGAVVTSAYRPTLTASGTISNHARGLAVDIVGRGGTSMGQIFNTLASRFGGSALELIYSPAGSRQILRGRPHFYTGVTRSIHYDHVHWAMPSFGGVSGAAASSGGGFSVPNPFDAIGAAARALLSRIPGAGTLPARLAAGMAKALIDKAGSWFASRAMSVFGAAGSPDPPSGGGAVGSGVSRWGPVVRRALAILGEPASLEQTVLRRMNQESGGNPAAINRWDINARRGTPSKGLMQVIDPTFRAYAQPGYDKNIYDPLSNVLASMRYARARYGSLPAAYNRAGGYALGGTVVKPVWYDSGGYLPPGLSLVANGTGRYETVRTYEQEKALRTGTGGQIVINGIRHDSVPEFVDALTFAMRRRENRGRYAGVR